MWFFNKGEKKKDQKMFKKGKKGKNIWKFEQKHTKFENILKKSRWLHAIMKHNKLLEKALFLLFYISFYVSRYHFPHVFRILFNIWKKLFVTNFPFLIDSFKYPHPLNGEMLKVFCWCSLTVTHNFT